MEKNQNKKDNITYTIIFCFAFIFLFFHIFQTQCLCSVINTQRKSVRQIISSFEQKQEETQPKTTVQKFKFSVMKSIHIFMYIEGGFLW